jgi:hypothetical protein
VDKLCELCDVKEEVSGNESSSFPPDVVGNTAGGKVRLSRPTVPTGNKYTALGAEAYKTSH